MGGGVVRHGVAAVGRQASDRLAVVASLHCAALLLALLLLPYSHGLVVCRHELLSALRDVRVLRPDDDQVPQAHHPVCDLHHAGAACADARRDVCDHQGHDVAGCGAECHVNKTNSVLGLTMYASYFLLFFKLFVENYVTQTRRRGGEGDGLPPKRKSLAAATRALSRTISSKVNPQVDSDGEEYMEESSLKRDSKKLN